MVIAREGSLRTASAAVEGPPAPPPIITTRLLILFTLSFLVLSGFLEYELRIRNEKHLLPLYFQFIAYYLQEVNQVLKPLFKSNFSVVCV